MTDSLCYIDRGYISRLDNVFPNDKIESLKIRETLRNIIYDNYFKRAQRELRGNGWRRTGIYAEHNHEASARKLRNTFDDGKVIAGFAGSTADAFTLFEKFDEKLEQYNGKLLRSAVELAKEWRTDKMLRNLEALLAVSSAEASLVISGNGDVIEPDDGLIGIGSGGMYALAAARALIDTKLSPKKIAEKNRNSIRYLHLY